MKCRKAKQLIHLYIDGEIQNDDLGNLLLHIEECPTCNIYYDRMRETKDMLNSCRNYSAPEVLKYLIVSNIGYKGYPLKEVWFSTLQFRMLETPIIERLRAAVLAAPITMIFFLLISILVYSPQGIRNIQHLLMVGHPMRSNFEKKLVERQYLENLYDFSPEVLSPGDFYQPRISTVPIKFFAENDFQKLDVDHLSVVAIVKRDGSAKVEKLGIGQKDINEKIQNLLNSSIVFPAVSNGKIVKSKLLLTFEKVVVKG